MSAAPRGAAMPRAARRRGQDVADLAFRLLFSLIFVVAGAGHLLRTDAMVERLVAAPLAHLATALAPPGLLVVLTGVALLAGGLGLVLGYHTRAASLLLIAVLVPITVTMDLGHTGAIGPLFKNVALLGGLIHFATRGPGPFSVDRTARDARLE